MTADVARELDRIERGIASVGRSSVLALLRPGLPPERVRALLVGCGLPSTASLEVLYGWRDGTGGDDEALLGNIYFFPGFYLLSLEDAVANYQAFVNDSRWMAGWLPVFANGGGDFYVLSLTGEIAGEVRHFRIDESEHPIEFESLPAMLQTLAEGFIQGLFYVDSGGYLEMDALKFAAMAARINPNVSWWRD